MRSQQQDGAAHDTRQTFARQLRAAEVLKKDSELLPGHASLGMRQHDATATSAHLVEAANLANTTRDQTTLLQVVNGESVAGVAGLTHKPRRNHAQRKTG